MQVAAPSERLEAVDFSSVYDAHVDFVWSMLRRLGVGPEVLEDAVQDVFVVVHRQLPAFQGRSTLRTWVGGIAVRVASEHRRRARRAGRCEPIEAGERIPCGRGGPEELAAAARAWARLERLLDGLDEDQRTVFVLSALEELSAPEVAQIVGAPLNTVYSRLRLARAKLEAAMADERGEVER